MSNLVKTSAKKAKQHTIYKNAAGTRLPGVTTITGVLDKPALVPWANKLGLQGVNVREYVDDLAGAGTACHRMIENHIGSILDPSSEGEGFGEFSADQLDLAANGFVKFLSWEELHKPTYLASELRLVSEANQYGGTVDCYAEIGGRKTLIDFKTCKGIYIDHHLQVAGGYAPMLRENGYEVDDVCILRIGRDESEGDTEYVKIANRDGMERMFDLCLQVYNLKRELKWR